MALVGFRKALKDERELEITVKGRKTGRKIPLPVWFAVDGDKLRLLPVKGSASQWYRNVVKDNLVGFSTGREKAQLKAAPVTDKKVVDMTVQLFREKYGEGDVKRYYSKFDAAVEFSLIG